MKKLQLLKSVIDLFFLLAFVATAGMVLLVPVFMMEDKFPLRISGREIETGTWPVTILLVLTLSGSVAFLYGVYLLRRIVALFRKLVIFDDEIIALLRQTGRVFLFSILLTDIPPFIYDMVKHPAAGIEFSNNGFGSFLFSIALALFFLVLAEVFRIAKRMKEENELTV